MYLLIKLNKRILVLNGVEFEIDKQLAKQLVTKNIKTVYDFSDFAKVIQLGVVMEIKLDDFTEYPREVKAQVLQGILLDQMFARLIETTNEIQEMKGE